MADNMKERALILLTAKEQGKPLKPEHEAELQAYYKMGEIKKPEGPRIPVAESKPLEEKIGTYGGLATSLKTFDDKYAGNTITGGLENSIQGKFSSFGTPGQRDWWASFRANDNVIRNQLFGASLTEGEKQAYQATTVSEDLDAVEVRKNLETRRDIVRGALKRKVRFLRKQGYNPEAIDELVGEWAGDFADEPEKVSRIEDPRQMMGVADAIQNELGGDPEGGLSVDVGAFSPEQQAAFDKLTPEQREAWKTGKLVVPELSDDVATGSPVKEGPSIGSAVEAGVVGAADSLLLGGADEAAAAIGTVLPIGRDNIWSGKSFKEAFDLNLQQTSAYKDELAEDRPVASIAGQVAGLVGGGLMGARALPGIASAFTSGSRGARIAKSSAGAAGLGGAYGFNSENDDRTVGAVKGAIAAPVMNAAGQGVAKAAGRALNPTVRAALKKLSDAGVRMTPGQLAGGGGFVGRVVKRVEDWAAGVPLIGDTINLSRQKVVEEVNNAAIEEALKPIGKSLPPGVNVGHDAITWAEGQISKSYDDALSTLSAQADQPFMAGIANVNVAAQNLPKAQQELFQSIVERDIKPFIPNSGVFDGAQIQAIKRGLDARIAKLRTGSPAEEMLAETLTEARSEFMDLALRQSPQEAAAFRAADEAFRNFVPVQRAAAQGKNGVFSPGQLRVAVRQSDRSVRKKATSRGDAPMQELSDAASDILPSSIPDTGSGGRALAGMGLMGAFGAGGGYMSTGDAAGAIAGGAALAAPYSRVGRAAIQGAVIGNRRPILRATGRAIDSKRRLIGAGAASGGLLSIFDR